MGTFLFAITGLSSILGALMLAFFMFGTASAPQQAAGAACAIGLAVIPYVLARLYQLSQKAEMDEARYGALVKALERLAPAEK